ncbi:MAG TPA: hypothetical protein VMU36_07940 [Spirochaetia bacterium]|nr:hypothetical protein [Spirochaetia bacterium]
MRTDVLDRVARVLSGIRGVIAAVALDDGRRHRVIELESLHERKLSLPVRNLGVSLMADRDACFVVLKTATFRPPKSPSVYLVEEGGEREGDHELVVAGKRYTIVGQEVTGDILRSPQHIIPLDESFVIFPDRRSGPNVPCFFLLPPLPFPELEKASGELGLKGVISISPSLVSDAFLRESFGFPRSNSLATLLVGFDLA